MSKTTLLASLESELENLKTQNLFRQLKATSPNFIDFYSNDYLGIAKQSLSSLLSPEEMKFISIGSTGSRLISGNSLLHEEVETFIAQFHDFERALLFPSGFQANLCLFSTLGKRNVHFLVDEHIHASIKEGIRNSFASKSTFHHNDWNHLEHRLKHVKGEPVVVVESLYSIHGDEPDWNALASLLHTYNASLIIDEAHSIGVFGQHGEGLAPSFLKEYLLATIVTYGKAFGFQGAAILTYNPLYHYLINKGRPFIYTTAPSPLFLHILKKIYFLIQSAHSLRSRLHQLFASFNEQITPLASYGKYQIRFLPIGNRTHLLQLHQQLLKLRIHTGLIRKPTVPSTQEGLRISLHVFNPPDDIAILTHAIKRFLETY